MNYRKGLQILMMAVLLGSIGVLSAEAQEQASNAARQQWEALQDQGAARYQAGDYAEAERIARQALALAEHAFGPDHFATAVSLNNLAMVLQDQGRYEEAEPLLRRARAIAEKVLGTEHPDIAGSSGNAQQQWKALQEQFVAHYRAGDYAGAEQLARKALAIAERAVGPEHPATAISLNNLGVCRTSGCFW